MNSWLRRVAGVAAVLLLTAAAAFADGEQTQLNGWNATLNQVDATLRRSDLGPGDLAALRTDVENVLLGAGSLKDGLQPQIADAEARIQSLAPLPGATGASEPPAVVVERERQQAILGGLIGLLQQADVVVVRSTQLLSSVDDRTSAQFKAALLARGPSIFSPDLWAAIGGEAPGVLDRTGRLASDWFALVAGHAKGPTVLLIVGLLVLVVGIFFFRRWFLSWAAGRRAGVTEPSQSLRVVTAAAIFIVDLGVPVLALLGLRLLFAAHGLLPDRIGGLAHALTLAVFAFAGMTGLARALLEPARPDWRIAEIPDWAARRLSGLIALAAFLLALIPLVRAVAVVTVATPGFALAIGAALTLLVAAIILAIANTIARARAAETTATPRSGGWHWLVPLATVAAIVAIVAEAIGYLALGQFLVGQVAWIWAVLGALLLALGLVGDVTAAALASGGALGRAVTRNLGLSERALNQATIIVDGMIRLLFLLLALALIAAPWGFTSDDIFGQLPDVLTGVRIGSITITFSTILAALAVFVVGVVVARVFQNWLDKRFLPMTRMDTGLRDSITTGLGYVGVILAAILAFTYAGFNLANVAIVAGALSVGIGFGLQSIVNNFVSGLILLAERPIRTGDWIVVGADEGLVKRIRVRATEIETFDRASVIIPNSNLISGVVKNLFFRDSTGRILVTIGVGYASDPNKVRDILLDCARKHPDVIQEPPPSVVFADFGESSLDFELRCYVTEALLGASVKSDLRFAILTRMREEGIEIPFPQSDLNLRDLPRIEKVLRDLTDGAGWTGRQTEKQQP